MSPHSEDFRFLASNSADVICRCDVNSVMRYVSPSSTRVLGWAPEEMTGKRILDFAVMDDIQLLTAAVAQWHAPEIKANIVVARLKKRDGSICWYEIHTGIVHDEAGYATGAAVVIRDTSERKLLEDKLIVLASTDGLTGLANRRSFDEALEREWARTLHDGSKISLILLDIDHFKRFNDCYGHQAGDSCLRDIATSIMSTVRKTDIVARYGGEEIAIILPDCGAAEATAIAENIRQAIERLEIPYKEAATGTNIVTASLGVTTSIASGSDVLLAPEALIQIADRALYMAKLSGRNTVATA
ncbi:MAG: sensor domain-containing diguanylate cyclase [Acidobacteriaceae bacterium]|nr:sensor domain-containing diguanylate cyclase [Acidobacteriaceae bacterium]